MEAEIQIPEAAPTSAIPAAEMAAIRQEMNVRLVGYDDMSPSVYNEDPVVSGGDMGGSGSETDQSVPRVIVTGFDTEPAQVKAGSDFKLIIHLKNTSKKTAVSNMLFDLQAPAAGTDEAAEARHSFLCQVPVPFIWRKFLQTGQKISLSS